jgi:hypothetical protein
MKYFHDGWIMCVPGSHRMRFALPPEATAATTCSLKPRSEVPEGFSINYRVWIDDRGLVSQSFEGGPITAVTDDPLLIIEWNNETDQKVAVDYLIEPR